MDKCLFLVHFSCIQWQAQIYLGFKVLQGNCTVYLGWQIVSYWLEFPGLRQIGKSEDQSGALRAKTEFLQVVLSTIFLSDNIYSITKSDILENKPKGEGLMNYFSKLYHKDNYSPALPARLIWMIDSRIQQGSERGLFSLILWSQRTQKVT